MKKTVLALAACTLATGTLAVAPAFAAETMTQKAKEVGEDTGVNTALGIAPTTKDFVEEAAVGNMFEVQSSKLAEERTQGKTKEFAAQMVKDHSAAQDKLKSAAGDANVAVPTKLDEDHQEKLDALKKLKGKDFAKKYHDDQLMAHRSAVSLFKRYSKGGDNEKLKSFASNTLPHLEQHLDMAKKLDK